MFHEFFKIEKNHFFPKFHNFENCYVKNLKGSQTRITLLQIKKHYMFFISDKPNLRYLRKGAVEKPMNIFPREPFPFLVQGLIKL